MIDFAIVVVSYRSGPDLPALIASIGPAAGAATWQLFIVDNAGEDLRARLTPDERVTVLDAGGNLGYSGGLNVGIAHAPQSRWIVFLNPDLVLGVGALSALAAVDASVAASVPQIIDEDGRRQDSLRREPALLSALGDAIFGDLWPNRPGSLSETVRGDAAYRASHAIEWATGAALAVRTAAVATVGAWDSERFFMYSEETDYARRVRAQAGQIRYVPTAVVAHRAGGSGSSAALDALLEVNKVRYFAKWHGTFATIAFGAITVLRNAVRPHRPGARKAVGALLSPRVRATLPGGAR